MKSKLSLIFLIFFFLSCKEREKVYEHYPNGKVKTLVEMKNGVRDGISEQYDSNGVIQYKVNYSNGLLEGKAREYFESGSIERELFYSRGRLDSGYFYYEENSVLEAKCYFDDIETVERIELFDKNGLRDSSEHIYSTIKKIDNGRYHFIWRLLNVIPDDVRNSESGEMIVSTGLNFKDVVKFHDYYHDTIAIVKPTNKTHFTFEFNRQDIKGDSIFGVINFQLSKTKETVEVKTYFVAAKID